MIAFALKETTQGTLIYATMAVYVVAFAVLVAARVRRGSTGEGVLRPIVGWLLYHVGYGLAMVAMMIVCCKYGRMSFSFAVLWFGLPVCWLVLDWRYLGVVAGLLMAGWSCWWQWDAIVAAPRLVYVLAAMVATAPILRRLIARGSPVLLFRVGYAIYFAGFGAAVAMYAYRWHKVERLPMSDLFEVFLCLGALVFLISVFSRVFLRVGMEMVDALLGAIVLVPAGFYRSAEPNMTLMPALQSPLFGPHITAYMFAYVILAKAAFLAAAHLFGGKKDSAPAGSLADSSAMDPLPTTSAKPRRAGRELLCPADAAYRLVRFGFPPLTLGLLLGSIWGKIAWGDVWFWDSKELWSLICWLIYGVYLHFRYLYGHKFRRVGSALVVVGLVAIILTLLWVNLSDKFKGLHSYAS